MSLVWTICHNSVVTSTTRCAVTQREADCINSILHTCTTMHTCTIILLVLSIIIHRFICPVYSILHVPGTTYTCKHFDFLPAHIIKCMGISAICVLILQSVSQQSAAVQLAQHFGRCTASLLRFLQLRAQLLDRCLFLPNGSLDPPV